MVDVARLFRFILQFGIDRFQILEVTEKKIRAVVGWPSEGQADYDPNEEVQEIVWDIQKLENIDDALEILEIAYSKGFFDSDKLTISKEELWQLTSWERERFNKAIQDLLEIRVDMVDDGRRTDYFFVHF
ncbi:hypothetical protein [Microbulbifer epialgicus]|uniref:Uncharacterized protein n=1 Tax=Microbulbifer epialgicus TaxID=393907 RepID=A0ABV4P7J3_9GAMM